MTTAMAIPEGIAHDLPTTRPTSDVLSAAHRFLAAGCSVIPIRPDGSKRPALTEWTTYQGRLPTVAEANAWWANGKCGLAVVCGAVSGNLEMIELEGRAVDGGIVPNLIELARTSGVGDLLERIADGYTERSPSGGLHFLLRHEHVTGNHVLAINDGNNVLAETRGEGGYVIVAPTPGSCHESGTGWVMEQGSPESIPTITTEERSELAALFRSFDRKPKAAPSATRFPVTVDGTRPGDAFNTSAEAEPIVLDLLVHEGWQVQSGNGAAVNLRRPGKSVGTSATLGYVAPGVLHVFSTSCPSGLDHGAHSPFDVYTQLRHGGDYSAAAKDLAAQGYGVPSKASSPSSASSVKRLDAHDGPCLPPFPVKALPPWAGDFVTGLAEQTQTPPDMGGTLFLGALATVAQGKVSVDCGAWVERTPLYVAVVAGPGEHKSEVVTKIRAPLVLLEAEVAKSKRSEIARATAARDVMEQKLNRFKKEAANASPDDADIAYHEVMDLQEKLAATPIPAEPRLFAHDATTEAIVTGIFEQGGRLAVMNAEGGGLFDLMMGRYSKGQSTNIDIILLAWTGEEYRVDRKGRPAEHIDQAHLTIAVAVQPCVIATIRQQPELVGRGLVPRFLISWPVSLVGTRKIDVGPMAPQVRDNYVQTLSSLGRAFYEQTHARMLTLSSEAQRIFKTYRQRLEGRLSPDSGDLAHMADWGSKAHGQVARIAGLLHIGGNVRGDVIDSRTMRNAIEIGEYFTAHAKNIYTVPGRSNVERTGFGAADIAQWALRLNKSSFTVGEVIGGCGTRTRKLTAPDVKVHLANGINEGLFEHIGDGRYRVAESMAQTHAA